MAAYGEEGRWYEGYGRSGGEDQQNPRQELRPAQMERSGSVHSFLVTPDDLELPSYYHSDAHRLPLPQSQSQPQSQPGPQYQDPPDGPPQHCTPDALNNNAYNHYVESIDAAPTVADVPHQHALPLSASVADPRTEHQYSWPRQSGEHHHHPVLQRGGESGRAFSSPSPDNNSNSSARPYSRSHNVAHQQANPSRPITAQRRQHLQHAHSGSNASFERLASTVSSEAGGTARSSLMSDPDSSSAATSSPSSYTHNIHPSTNPRLHPDATGQVGYNNRDARANQLHSVPETSNSGGAAAPTSYSPPPAMSSHHLSSTPSASKVLRTASIDSAVSSVSSHSTPTHSSSSNNPFSNIKGDSPADIQALIRAAGSPEELIKYMLKDKQSLTAQNAQLWRLVDKQRAMILGLNKDLERALKDKERYRRKFSQQAQMTAPPMSSVPSRSVSESPAPSLDESRHGGHSPAESARSESVPLVARDQQVSPTTTFDQIAPYNATPSPTSHYMLVPGSGNVPVSSHMSQVENVNGNQQQQYVESRSRPGTGAVETKADSVLPLHSAGYGAEPSPSAVIESSESGVSERAQPPSLSVVTDSPESFYRQETPSTARPLTLAKKLGISTNVPPAMGMGKSPMRKAPPAPLELSPQREQMPEIDNFARIGDITSASINPDGRQHNDTQDGTEREAHPAQAGEHRAAVPLVRPTPIPALAVTEGLASPRINHQFARNGIASPGLPSSPRPSDRPPNSPMPRRSLDQQIGGPAMSPRGHNQGTGSLSSLSNVMNAPGLDQLSRKGSLGSIPQGAALDMPPPSAKVRSAHSESSIRSPSSDRNIVHSMVLHPSAINSIDVRVVSSRLRPSRMSMIAGKAGSGGDSVFTLGVFSRIDNKEIVRVEKDAPSLTSLDNKLRKTITFNSTVPDKSLFSGHAPAKIDARRAAIDAYFDGILSAVIDEKAAMKLCEFFSADVVDLSPSMDPGMRHSPRDDAGSIGSKVVKEGYLTKRGKNFGGWKERYFVLDGPVLKYFDGLGGVQLGQIKLQHAQIGRQSSQPRKEEGPVDEETEYRHAFLVLEPKKKDSATLVRHVLCAESDAERDEWVDALLMFVERPEGKEKRPTTKGGEDTKSMEEEKLRALSYEEANPGPIPARGPTPEDMRRNASPSPSSITNQSGQQFASHAPVPERGPVKQISAPQGGAVISDLSAWGAGKKPNSTQTDKALKKRSIFSFGNSSKQRSHELDNHYAEVSGHQAAAQRFPLPRAVFGASLEEAVYLTKPPGMEIALPAVVYRCIEYLNAKNASQEEGIFRLSGSSAVIKGLKERFNSESDFNLLAQDEYFDVHAISGLLKLYLRELPSNVLTTERREDFVKVTELTGDPSRKVNALNELVHSLPIENFTLLKTLSGHLLEVVDNSDMNKMTIRNIGIVFSPTLNIPAQVFSMFLEQYYQIFFREGEPPSPAIPRPSSSSMPPPNSSHSLQQQFQAQHSAQSQPQPQTPLPPQSAFLPPPPTPGLSLPRTPLTARPPQMIPLPATPAFPPPPETPSYEPTYDTRPAMLQSPTTPRFQNSGEGGGLAVPGSDAKSQKSKRRESSMMFMKGLKSPMFGPPKGNNTTLVVEDSVYE